MNAIFSVLFLGSAIVLFFLSPEQFLPTLIDGASKSAALCFALIATYAVWLGLMNVWTDSGVTTGASRLLRPLMRRLFKTDDRQTLDAVCMNTAVNLLGISGAATAYGLTAAKRLENAEHAEYSCAMLFVLNATSIQVLPTSVIGVRTALGSANPADILLPTLLATAFSTLLGLALVRLLIPPCKRQARQGALPLTLLKTGGTGI